MIDAAATPLANVNGYAVYAEIEQTDAEPLYVVSDTQLRPTQNGSVLHFGVATAAALVAEKAPASPVPLKSTPAYRFGDLPPGNYGPGRHSVPYREYAYQSQDVQISLLSRATRMRDDPDAINAERKIEIFYAGEGGEIKVITKLDERDPANFIQSHRERKEAGQTDELADRSALQERLVSRIVATKKGDISFWRDKEVEALVAQLAMNDVKNIDDTVGLKPEHSAEVGEAIARLEDNEDEQIIADVKEGLKRPRRYRKLLGALAVVPTVGLGYLDYKNGSHVLFNVRNLTLHDPMRYGENALFWGSALLQVDNGTTILLEGNKLHRIHDYEEARPRDITDLTEFVKNRQFGEHEFIWRLYNNRKEAINTIAQNLFSALAR